MSAYAWVPFFEAVQDATRGNPKVQRKSYLPEGPVPILDQGQGFIAGYTTTDNAYRGQLPVVLFGDHTLTFKYVDFPFAMGADGVKVLVPQEGFDAAFLYWYFRNADIPSAGYSRHFKFLRELSICKPPLDEQRRIVGILNRAAKIERLRARAEERLQEFIPALFIEMFGDPAANPMTWSKRKIGQICIPTGQRNPTKDPIKEFRYVDISGVSRVLKKISKFQVLLGKDAPIRARKEIRKDDVIVSSVRPNLNAVAMVPEELDGEIASTGLCVLRANRKLVDPIYLFSYSTLAYFVETLTSKVRGANYPAVSDKDIKNIEITLPPLDKQRRFAKIIEAAKSATIRAESGSLASKALSASLMSRLLETDT